MTFRSVVLCALLVGASAFQPASFFSKKATAAAPKIGHEDNAASVQSSSVAGSSTSLLMAFQSSQPSNMFDGPAPLVKERDACGVGFVANVNNSGEYGSHKVLQQGLSALTCMEHRGACGGDGVSGDGAGIMTQIPWQLFADYRSDECPQPGVGMVFLPQDEERRDQVKKVIEDVCAKNELSFVGWLIRMRRNQSLGIMRPQATRNENPKVF